METIIALTSDAYERVMTRLQSGEEFVKTYRNICHHKKMEDCDCPFWKNILINGEIVRIVNGETIKVHNLAKLKLLERANTLLKKINPNTSVRISEKNTIGELHEIIRELETYI
mgnify:CR=1|tara:strand:+ start:2282 stop:2623 length:342 start_codon:yes stop_codon:yes gene_type:complete